MKKLVSLLLAIGFCLSTVVISAAAPAVGTPAAEPVQVVPKARRITRKSYRRGRVITVTTWRRGKRVTKKVWVGGNRIGRKVVTKTKHFMVGKPKRRP